MLFVALVRKTIVLGTIFKIFLIGFHYLHEQMNGLTKF